MGQAHSTSNFNQLDVQSKGMILEGNLLEKRQLNEPVKKNFKADSCELSAGSQIQSGSSKRSLDSCASEDVPNSGITSGIGTNYEEKASLHNSHYSLHILSGSLTSQTSGDELNVGSSKNILRTSVNGTTYAGIRARKTGAPQNHWFGPVGDPRGAGIGTPEAIKLVWSFHREIIFDIGPLPTH